MQCGRGGPTAVEVVLDTKHPATAWEGWGTSLAWFAHALGHDPGTRDLVCQLLFSKEHGLGLNIVRYNIGGSSQQHVEQFRPGGAVPCFAQPDGSYNWDADSGQVSMLLAAAQLGADTFEAFVNSPPWFWTVSGSSRGHQRPLRSNLDKQHIQDYAKFCADVVNHFQSAHGIRFQSVSPLNEPSSPAWCLAANCKQEACFFSRSRAQKVLRALTEQPSLRHTQIAVFEQFCIRDTLGDLTHLPRDLRPSVSRVNTHTYNSGVFFPKLKAAPLKLFQDSILARKRLRRLLHKWGDVPLWVSEFGTGRGAVQLARHIVKDLSTLLPTAWVYWQAVEDLGAGWGLLEMPMHHPNTSACSAGSSTAAAAAAAATGGSAGDVDGGSGGTEGDRKAGGVAAGSTAELLVAAAVQGRPEAAVQKAGASSASLQGSSKAGAVPAIQQQQQTKAVLHPNYFVLHFLVQSVPVRSRLYRVKGFGRRGVGVWRPGVGSGQGAWSLLHMNASSTTRTFRLSASSFPAVMSLQPAEIAHRAGASRVGSVGENGAAVGHGQVDEVAAAPSRLAKALAVLLDVGGLQHMTVEGGLSAAQLSSGLRRDVLQVDEVDGEGSCCVEVPAGHLCRVECQFG